MAHKASARADARRPGPSEVPETGFSESPQRIAGGVLQIRLRLSESPQRPASTRPSSLSHVRVPPRRPPTRAFSSAPDARDNETIRSLNSIILCRRCGCGAAPPCTRDAEQGAAPHTPASTLAPSQASKCQRRLVCVCVRACARARMCACLRGAVEERAVGHVRVARDPAAVGGAEVDVPRLVVEGEPAGGGGGGGW